MSISLKAQMQMNGFVFMSEHRCATSATEVAHALGELLSLGDGAPIHSLVVRKTNNATPNTYSGIYGNGEFPFHTDLAHWVHPPRFLFLRCSRGFEEVPTLLIDGLQLVDRAGSGLLSRALVSPRRPISFKCPLLRLFRKIGDDVTIFRWDEVFLKPSGRAGKQGMQMVREIIKDIPPTIVPLAKPGDTLIVDNWRMLHARSRVPAGCESRCLERAYLGEIK